MFEIHSLDRLLGGRLLVPGDIIHLVVYVAALSWLIDIFIIILTVKYR
jgi:hypothetical protein